MKFKVSSNQLQEMLNIANFYDKAKEKNIFSGVVIVDLITFISYMIFPFGLFFQGDFHMILGVLFGVYFGLSNKKKHQPEVKFGLVIGFIGALLAAISLTMFKWVSFTISQGFSTKALLFFFSFFVIEAVIIGLAVGVLLGIYFRRKGRKINLQGKIDEKFYKSLEEN
ncbi:MAG TPA: hypothetical protein ENI29_18410 [bacterium]|nr:hypothetical protein [bacterium]